MRFLLPLLFLLILPIIAKAEPTQSIGGYSNGCIYPAAKLALSGKGYEVVRTERQRNFGSDELMAFIKDLSNKFVTKSNMKVLISDLTQKGGGRMKGAHASHQTGLDVDIWNSFVPETKTMNDFERNNIQPNQIIADNGKNLTPNWGSDNEELIFLAASQANVERIFVNPLIKQHLCRKYPKNKLQYKVRPWWGHDLHFHVRLKCPAGNSYCEPQAQISAAENTCDTEKLAWWFSDEAKKELEENRKKPSIPPAPNKQCELLKKQGKI